MNNNKSKKKQNSSNQELLTFLKLTKEGKYSPIDKNIVYARITEETDTTQSIEEDYYYSLS